MSTAQTLAGFKGQVLHQFFQALHTVVPDNFDARRFNIDGKDHSGEFNVGEHVFFIDWFFEHEAALFDAQQQLADPASRALFQALVLFRLGGHLHVRLPSAVLREQERLQRFRQAVVSTPSAVQLPGAWGPLKHFDFHWEGRHYVIDCLNLTAVLALNQYQYDRDGVRIAPEPGDHVIDGGACLGDTAVAFSHLVGPTGRVYAFDPVEEHLLMCFENVRQLPHQNVTVLPVGLANENVDAPPFRMGSYSPGFSADHSTNGTPLPLRTIDFLVDSGEVERIDFIKFDIEGAELDGLRGGLQSIQRFRPKLAISLYHKPNDLFEIIQFVAQHFPFYEMHLDHYTIHREETVLYCIARDTRH